MIYRREIDGLRAFAVVPVILFHAGFWPFDGGFVGVDVFFVISGYLITSLIYAEYKADKFSVIDFYERRARRLLPALFFVMSACVPFAYFWMLPDDLENFGQSLVATGLFSNNILLWLTSNYFELNSEFKPLLHTWSLAVEEQYYVLFPLFIGLLWRYNKKLILPAVLVVALSSLALSIWASAASPVLNFYLLPSRTWELLIGSILALIVAKRGRLAVSSKLAEALSALGLCAIVLPVFLYTKETPFPGSYALPPTIGAALIIAFANSKNFVGRVLSSRICVGIGLVSYSAYLWHWPLFTFARIGSLDQPSAWVFGLLCCLTFALAYLTWLYIEKPFRNKGFLSRSQMLMTSCAGGALLVGVGLLFHVQAGFIQSWPELLEGSDSYGTKLNAAYNEKVRLLTEVPFDDTKNLKVLVVGNSMARDFINAANELGKFNDSSVSYSPAPLECISSPADVSDKVRGLIRDSDFLIFGSPSVSLKCWQSDVSVLRTLGAKKIIVIGTKNFGWNMNAVMHLDPAERYSYRAKVVESVWKSNEELRAALGHDYYLDVIRALGGDDGRVPVFTEDKKIISQDKIHLTKAGAAYVGERIFKDPLLASFNR